MENGAPTLGAESQLAPLNRQPDGREGHRRRVHHERRCLEHAAELTLHCHHAAGGWVATVHRHLAAVERRFPQPKCLSQ